MEFSIRKSFCGVTLFLVSFSVFFNVFVLNFCLLLESGISYIHFDYSRLDLLLKHNKNLTERFIMHFAEPY